MLLVRVTTMGVNVNSTLIWLSDCKENVIIVHIDFRLELQVVFDTVIGCGKILWGIILIVFLICVLINNCVKSSSVLLFTKFEISPVLWKGSLVRGKLN